MTTLADFTTNWKHLKINFMISAPENDPPYKATPQKTEISPLLPSLVGVKTSWSGERVIILVVTATWMDSSIPRSKNKGIIFWEIMGDCWKMSGKKTTLFWTLDSKSSHFCGHVHVRRSPPWSALALSSDSRIKSSERFRGETSSAASAATDWWIHIFKA